MKKAMLLAIMLSSVYVQILPSNSGDGFAAVVFFGLVCATSQYLLKHETITTSTSCAMLMKDSSTQKTRGYVDISPVDESVDEDYDSDGSEYNDGITLEEILRGSEQSFNTQLAVSPAHKTSPIRKASIFSTHINSLICPQSELYCNNNLGGSYINVDTSVLSVGSSMNARFDTNQSKGTLHPDLQKAELSLYHASTKSKIVIKEGQS